MALSLQKEEVLWLWLSSVTYGFYTAVFVICVYILLSRRAKDSINKHLLVVIVLLYISSTVAIALNFTSILLVIEIPSDHAATSNDLRAPHLITSIQAPFMLVNSLIGDALLIWRCYMVWGKRLKIIIFPALSYLISAGTFCTFLYGVAALQISRRNSLPDGSSPQQEMLGASVFMFYGASFVSVLVTTALISGRIIWINRGVRKHFDVGSGNAYQRVAIIILESGAAYTLCIFFMFLLGFLGIGTSLGLFPSIFAAMLPTALVGLVALGKVMHPTTVHVADINIRQEGSLPLLQFAPSDPSNNIESHPQDFSPYSLYGRNEANSHIESAGLEKQSVGIQAG